MQCSRSKTSRIIPVMMYSPAAASPLRHAPQEQHFSDFTIAEDCRQRLLNVELNIVNGSFTFDSVKWAISLLQSMEKKETAYFGDGDRDGEDRESLELGPARSKGHRDCGVGSPREAQSTQMRGVVPESVNIETPTGAALSVGNRNPCPLEITTDDDGNVMDRDRENDNVRSREDLRLFESRKSSHRSNASQGNRRKPDDNNSDGGRRTKLRVRGYYSNLEESVMKADRGESGKHMAERIGARLALQGYLFLTNFISQCLLLSMDQHPPPNFQDGVPSGFPGSCLQGAVASTANGSGRRFRLSDENDTKENGQRGWLHRWLVSTLLSGCEKESHNATLDWLVAYLTASKPSVFLRLVIDDLFGDLKICQSKGLPTLATYMRRVGILEFAALRDPEQVFTNFVFIVHPTATWSSKVEHARHQDKRYDVSSAGYYPSVWLALAALCPVLLGEFTRRWIPTLAVDDLQRWSLLLKSSVDRISFPAVWATLLGSEVAEPRGFRAWLRATFIRRLAQLAPVAANLVVLMSGVGRSSSSFRTGNDVTDAVDCLLTSLYKEISKDMLPKVIGSGQEKYRDGLRYASRHRDNGEAHSFMDTLKQFVQMLWEKNLSYCSTLTCHCFEVNSGKVPDLELPGRTEIGSANGKIEHEIESKFGETCRRTGTGCQFRDPFMKICQLTILCSGDHIVANLLAYATVLDPPCSGTFDTGQLNKLLMVMRTMKMIAGQGRSLAIFELWAEKMIVDFPLQDNEQALRKIYAMRQISDPSFWEKYQHLFGVSVRNGLSRTTNLAKNENRLDGLGWKPVWKQVRDILDSHWLKILHLLHRENAWELRLEVLTVLHLLTLDGTPRPQVVADRLKGGLGIFFSWAEISFHRIGMDVNAIAANGHTEVVHAAGQSSEHQSRLQRAQGLEQVKGLVTSLATTSYLSFTLLGHSLLDYSFELSAQKTFVFTAPTKTVLQRKEHLRVPNKNGNRSSFSLAVLATGRLDRFGKLVLATELDRNGCGSVQDSFMKLSEENRRINSGGFSALTFINREKTALDFRNRDFHSKAVYSTEEQERASSGSKFVEEQLGSLLSCTLESALKHTIEAPDDWPCSPVSVLVTLMVDRLETPHEVPMTMEQYEEVLPKQISSLRHIFLTECFSQNALLLEMLELVVKHGQSREVLRCVEFVRVLLADSISRWHSAFRSRRPHSLSPVKDKSEDILASSQVNRIIQLVASAGWLPQPLAASGEIVSLIDGADIADLLLLVWRCMHHAMAFGTKGWGRSSSNLHSAAASGDAQGQGTISGPVVDEEATKEGAYTEWESQYFAILRQNISQVGKHFAEVYPIRRTF